MTVRLNDPIDRAEWLQCLQAAASSPWSPHDLAEGVPPETLAQEADMLFEEFRKRCER